MTSEYEPYVRLVDGVACLAPVAARQNPDGTFHVLANPQFDPQDTSTLFEFLPGDDVHAEPRTLNDRDGPTSVLVATDRVRSSADDRDYWAVLFRIAWGGESAHRVAAERLVTIAARVTRETTTATRWHYPSVVEWAAALR